MPPDEKDTSLQLLQFRRSTPLDREAIIRLMGEGKPPGYYERKATYFDWQFGENPQAAEAGSFLVGVIAGEIAAANGLMPVRIRYKGRRIAAVWSCDTFVRRASRGRGYGKELIARVSREAPIVIGYGITDMSDPILIDNAWELNTEMRAYYCSVSEAGAKGLVKNLRTRLQRLMRAGRDLPAGDVEIHESGEFAGEVDDLWQGSIVTYHSVVERGAAYLNWKYRRHPRLRYLAYSVRHGNNLLGLLIARHHARESVIVDYCGPRGDAGLIGRLISGAAHDLSERGTVRIRCETTDSIIARALCSVGFVEYRGKPRFRVRTNLPGDSEPARDWFVMTGDSDHDLLKSPD